jgi:hypothetical protein
LAKPAAGAKAAPPKRKFGFADLWRTTLWALSAALAVTIAAYAGSTETGRERTRGAFAEIHEILLPSGVTPPRPLDAVEGRKLAETVRTLTADRDRLAARLATLERSMDDVTGSIARVEKAAQAAQQQPAIVAAAPAAPTVSPSPAPPPDEVTSSVSPPIAAVPMPPPPPGRSAFGLDLGTATTIEGVRTLWTAALRRHGTLIEGLRPVVYLRERHPGAVEFHLIAGPIPNAAAAARYCVTITAAGGLCQPAPYEGQRLALR